MESLRALKADLEKVREQAISVRTKQGMMDRANSKSARKIAEEERHRMNVASVRLQCLESRLADCVVRLRNSQLKRRSRSVLRIEPTITVSQSNAHVQASRDDIVQHYMKGRLVCEKVIRDRLKCLDAKVNTALAKKVNADNMKLAKRESIKLEIARIMSTMQTYPNFSFLIHLSHGY